VLRSLPSPSTTAFGIALAAALPTGVAAAQDEHHGVTGRMRADEPDQAWSDWELLTGDWQGSRAWLAERGVEISATFVVDTSWLFEGGEGGVDDRTTTRALTDLGVDVDLERAAGLAGTRAYLELYTQAGRNASDVVGDAQGLSNIDAENVAQLAELWVEHGAADGAWRFKLGKVDANGEFANVGAASEFLNSSAGYSPTIFPFPSYPDPATSANLFASPADGWQVGIGVYNAVDGGTVSGRRRLPADFDELFVVGQVDRTWGVEGEAGAGRAAVGGWHHTGAFDRFDGGTESGTAGSFALLEQRLVARGEEEGDLELTGFLQWGCADEAVSAFEGHLAAGLVAGGLVPGRESWDTGLYLTRADLSDDPGAGLGSGELAIELFQEVVLTPSVVLRPDLQVIVDPSGREDIGDAWVFTLRVELSL